MAPKDISGHPCTPNGTGMGLTLPLGGKSVLRQQATFQAPPPGEVLTLSPDACVAYADELVKNGNTLGMVCIGGPGEPMAQPQAVLSVISRIHAGHPEADMCLVTCGFNLPDSAQALAEAGLSRVAVNVNAVSAKAADLLYLWFRPGTRTLPKADGLAALLSDQDAGLRAAVAAGMEVTVETLVWPELGPDHGVANAAEVAKWAAERGAAAMRLLPARFDGDGQPLEANSAAMAEAEKACAAFLPVKPADCCCDETGAGELTAASGLEAGPSEERPYVAVATDNGADVNVHLGQAHKLLVYGGSGGHGRMVEVREAPPKGGGGGRWEKLADLLPDCFALLVADAGENPRQILAGRGITVRAVPDAAIEDAVADTLGLQRKKR